MLQLLLLYLFVLYVLVVTSLSGWEGAWIPPARFILVLTLPLAFLISFVPERVHNWAVPVFFGLTSVFLPEQRWLSICWALGLLCWYGLCGDVTM